MDLKLKDNNKLKFAPFIQLEYIESTGTQYIDTGIKADNNNQTFKIGISFLGNDQVIGSGERNRNQATATICRNTNKDLVINWGTWSASGSVLQSNYPLETLAEIEIKAGNVIKLNGDNTTIIAQNVSFTSGRTANFILNGSEDALDGSISGCVIRTHYFIVENDGREIIHLIPSKHNNIPCMYDTVTETFFYNSGTGNFIAGPSPIVGGLLPNNITLKTTTFYHKNTPNVDGLQLLNGILYVQETAEDVVLNRIRVDIGNVSGPLSEVMQYAGMAGFNDNYEPQSKPRLVGTWTINDWYTTSQLSQAKAAFDGLTIVEDPNYVLDFSEMAVQVLDPNEDNYNPAVAIALNSQNRGTTTIGAPLGYGRWFLTKTDAAAITSMSQIGSVFWTKTQFTDTSGIVSDNTSAVYPFDNFDEFQYFINITNAGGFSTCTNLESIVLHNNVTGISNDGFYRCYKLKHINLPQSITSIGGGAFVGAGSSAEITEDDLIDVNLPNLTSMGINSFQSCEFIKSVSNLGSITTMKWSFGNCANLESVILPNTITSITGDFAKCYKLKMPDLPRSITSIGKESFLNIGRDITITDDDLKTLNLPNLTSLGDFACAYNKFIKEVVNLGSITTLGSGDSCRGCFEACTNLISINIPQTVTIIGQRCFNNCQNLPFINLPQTITSIESEAFSNCKKLKLSSIPTSITSIGTDSFYNVGSSLTLTDNDLIELNLPNLTAIGQEAFNGCKLIKEVISLGTITTIGRETDTDSRVFESCPNLIKATLPSTLNKIIHRIFTHSPLSVIHLLNATPVPFTFTPVPGDYYYDTFGQHSTIYVGEGSSSSQDDAILADYIADTNWAKYSSRLDTWYNYLHPQS